MQMHIVQLLALCEQIKMVHFDLKIFKKKNRNVWTDVLVLLEQCGFQTESSLMFINGVQRNRKLCVRKYAVIGKYISTKC